MTDHSEFSELEERLGAYGARPVDPAVQSQHLTAMAATRPIARRSSLAHKVRVAGALVGGFFLGSTGLAFAGALPDQAQDVAQGALARVGITVQGGTERYQGAECGTPEGGGEWRNHGHYVRSQPEAEREAAGESDCGKPLVSVGKSDNENEVEGAGEPNECAAKGQAIAEANKERRGKPENPGKPDHAGQPDTTGKPECAPEGEADPAESGANDAVTDNQPSSTPAEPEAKPVETPPAPPEDTTGDEAGDTQGVEGKTPTVEEGEVPEESEVPEETPPEEVPPADEGAEEAPPED